MTAVVDAGQVVASIGQRILVGPRSMTSTTPLTVLMVKNELRRLMKTQVLASRLR